MVRRLILVLMLVALLVPILVVTAYRSPGIPYRPAEPTYSVSIRMTASMTVYWLDYGRTAFEVWAEDVSLSVHSIDPITLSMLPRSSAYPLALPVLASGYHERHVTVSVEAVGGAGTVESRDSASVKLQVPCDAAHGYSIPYEVYLHLVLKPGRYRLVLHISGALFWGYLESVSYLLLSLIHI